MDTPSEKWLALNLNYKNKNNKQLRVAVIGGGFYGCHLASQMANAKIQVSIYERSASLFQGASGWGDTRIHNGVKYLRNKKTRDLLASEKEIFMSHYGQFYTGDAHHECELQLITNDGKSLLDFGAFLDLYKSVEPCVDVDLTNESAIEKDLTTIFKNQLNSRIISTEIIEEVFGFKHIEGAVLHGLNTCPKLYIDTPRVWFSTRLTNSPYVSLYFNSRVVSSDFPTDMESTILKVNRGNESSNFLIGDAEYDYVFDCTYNLAFPISEIDQRRDNEMSFGLESKPFYEVGFSLVFAEKNDFVRTHSFKPFSIYDGPLPGMTPFNIENIDDSIFSKYKGRNLYTATGGRLGASSIIFDSEDAWAMREAGNFNAQKRYADGSNYSVNECEGDADAKKVLTEIQKYFPSLLDRFDVVFKFWWIKSLIPSSSSARPVIVRSNRGIHENFINVFSSKISTVFSAEQQLLELLWKIEQNNATSPLNEFDSSIS